MKWIISCFVAVLVLVTLPVFSQEVGERKTEGMTYREYADSASVSLVEGVSIGKGVKSRSSSCESMNVDLYFENLVWSLEWLDLDGTWASGWFTFRHRDCSGVETSLSGKFLLDEGFLGGYEFLSGLRGARIYGTIVVEDYETGEDHDVYVDLEWSGRRVESEKHNYSSEGKYASRSSNSSENGQRRGHNVRGFIEVGNHTIEAVDDLGWVGRRGQQSTTRLNE